MLPKDKPIVTTPIREVRYIEEKARTRKALREYIIKERSNPFRQAANMGGGYIQDPAFVRYEASNIFTAEMAHFKFTWRTTGFFLGFVIGPMVAIGIVSEYYRRAFDAKVRRGEVSYFDRFNKFT
ncbi:uncharacterized protein LOC117652801 [Thrips palmi]|uniref:NADH dehydrogenase [ubiquinone] 1 beta subcomplex subunit 4 n=1 Tax=Thrips palmi TaxID=161013 RepID=A0A6P9AD97_THRPL|nr:uncharacterized protein LOC117652801 [Thrips palmi]